MWHDTLEYNVNSGRIKTGWKIKITENLDMIQYANDPVWIPTDLISKINQAL